MPTSLSSTMSTVSVRASWDTQQRLTYNPNAPKNPFKKSTNNFPSSPSPSPSTQLSSITVTPQSVSALLKRHPVPQVVMEKFDNMYLGYERWMPAPPKVESPRSVYNAAALAYIGDGIFELYARRHFLFPPLSIEEFNQRVTAVVRSEAQNAFLQKLINDDCLSEEERGVLRWGKNIASAKTRTKKRVGAAAYNRASSLETLIGYLYLTNVNRLEEIMHKMGFSTGSSTELLLEEAESVQTS